MYFGICMPANVVNIQYVQQTLTPCITCCSRGSLPSRGSTPMSSMSRSSHKLLRKGSIMRRGSLLQQPGSHTHAHAHASDDSITSKITQSSLNESSSSVEDSAHVHTISVHGRLLNWAMGVHHGSANKALPHMSGQVLAAQVQLPS
jgi:hypothetical protein